MRRSNFFILGIAVAYLVLYIAQKGGNLLYADKLMVTISWVSLNLSFAELLKSLLSAAEFSISQIKIIENEHYDFFLHIKNNAKDHIEAKELDKIEISIKSFLSKNKKIDIVIKIIKVVTSIIIVTVYIFSVVRLILWPYLKLTEPTYDIMSAKYTLLAFSIMFFSIFVNESFSDFSKEELEKRKIYKKVTEARRQTIDALAKLAEYEKKEKSNN